MPVTNVRSRWIGGDLYFYDLAGNEILHVDGTNRKLVLPTGSELDVAGVAVDSTTLAADNQDGANVAVVADVNTTGGIPLLFRVAAAALTGNVDVIMDAKVRVIDAWCIATAAGGAGDTVTVSNGATAITDAMDLNVADKVLVRAASIDDAAHEIAAAGTLRVAGASAVNAQVYVLAVRVS